jgi:hypothetical protein
MMDVEGLDVVAYFVVVFIRELGLLNRYSVRLDGLGSIPIKGKIFLFSTASIPFLGTTQPHIQWAQGTISPRVKRRSVKPTTHLYLMPMSRMVEPYLH